MSHYLPFLSPKNVSVIKVIRNARNNRELYRCFSKNMSCARYKRENVNVFNQFKIFKKSSTKLKVLNYQSIDSGLR